MHDTHLLKKGQNKWEVLWINNYSTHRCSYQTNVPPQWTNLVPKHIQRSNRECVERLVVLSTCVGVCSSDHYHRCPDPSGLSEPQTIVLRLSEDWRLVIHILHIHNHLQTQTHNHSLIHKHTHAATHTLYLVLVFNDVSIRRKTIVYS